MSKTKKLKVLDRLLSGRSVTGKQALAWWELYRLSRIIELIRKEGYPVKTEMVKRRGGTFARYYMEQPVRKYA